MLLRLIGIYDIPEPGGLGRASGQDPEPPAPPASLSLGLDWIVTSRMSRLDWLHFYFELRCSYEFLFLMLQVLKRCRPRRSPIPRR